MSKNIVEFLELHELLPVPSIGQLSAKWTEGALRDFLDRYLAFLRQQSQLLHVSLNSEHPPSLLFLDPLDSGRRETFLQHLLLADGVVIMDPISVLHCPPRPLNTWLQQLHQALVFVQGIREMLTRGFVHTVPDPTHCGLHAEAINRAKAVLEDQASREIWFSHSHACKGKLPATISIGGKPNVNAPLYHFHLGPHFTMNSSFPALPGDKAAISKQPHIHFDMGGPNQRFDRISMKNAVIYEKLESQVKGFLLRPVAQYESCLLMARVWSNDRFSTLNPLTTAVLSRDLASEAVAVSKESEWIAPAECAIRMLGIESTEIGRALDFREKYADAFKSHLEGLDDIYRGIQSTTAEPGFRDEVGAIIKEKMQPRFRELEAETRSLAGTIKINAGFFGIITLAGTALILADPKNWIANAGTALAGLGPVANGLTEWWKGRVAQSRNPLYFLWKAREHGLSRKPH